ncbi:MAG: type II toxin-antitoxin system HicB family antitoxin [Candidatus Kapabacteria bacterium]|nr:type II toxin-antitoxin system HicB family antitoxin [Candidatus Kapabacteria bacterium]
MNKKLTIIIEEDENGFYAYCPDLKGCQSQGDTYDEAYENIKEAIDLYFETISSEDLPPLLSKNIFSTSYEVTVA